MHVKARMPIHKKVVFYEKAIHRFNFCFCTEVSLSFDCISHGPYETSLCFPLCPSGRAPRAPLASFLGSQETHDLRLIASRASFTC